MATNPLVSQGVLNRLRASVNVIDSPELNGSASFFGESGVSLALEGQATGQIGTLVGVANSPEPYLMASVVINLLKTQSLAALWKARMEKDSQLGEIVITPDAVAIGTYYLYNASIESVKDMQLNGKDAGYTVTVKGIYYINSDLWNLS
jgi:hypothetical protein